MDFKSKNSPSMGAYETISNEVEPSGVKYDQGLKPLGIEGRLHDMVFSPSNGESFTVTTTNRLVRIPINASGFLIPKESYIQLTFTPSSLTAADAAVTTTCGFNNTVHSIISNLRVIGTGGQRIEDIQQYNVLYEVFRHMQTSTEFNTNNQIKTGLTALMANATAYTNVLHPMTGLFLSNNYIPVGFVREPIVIEFDLETFSRALVTAVAAHATSSYVVSNIEFHACVLDLGQDYEENFRRKLVENDGIEWSGVGYTYTSASGTTGTLQNLNCALPYHSLKSVIAVDRLPAFDITTGATLSTFSFNTISQYQLLIGGKSYPENPVLISATNMGRAYVELQKCFGVPTDIGAGGIITRATYIDTNFIIGVDLESYNEDEGLIRSGIDTSDNRQMILRVQATGPGASTWSIFGLYDCIFYLSPTGELTATY